MKVTVTLEAPYSRLPDGSYWTSGSTDYSFWTRYLEVFEHVRVVARVHIRRSRSENWRQVDGPGVSVVPITPYHGPWQFIRQSTIVRREVLHALSVDDAIIMRIPSMLSAIVRPVLSRYNRPFGVEVVGDSYEVFAPSSMQHVLRPILRWWFPKQQREGALSACGVAYVTANELQRRYPASPSAYTATYSSIDLHSEAFISSSRNFICRSKPWKGIFVGSLEHPYKGVDLLLHSIAHCREQGVSIELDLLGDGKERANLENQASHLNIDSAVRFHGLVKAGEMVRHELDRADLFVLPSRTEGLPRAMLEAMARGLPCIGTAVGGIPELLGPKELVPVNDADALASKIIEVVSDRDRMTRLSRRNMSKAYNYRADVLQERRNAFYSYVREVTAAWRASAVV